MKTRVDLPKFLALWVVAGRTSLIVTSRFKQRGDLSNNKPALRSSSHMTTEISAVKYN